MLQVLVLEPTKVYTPSYVQINTDDEVNITIHFFLSRASQAIKETLFNTTQQTGRAGHISADNLELPTHQ